MIIFAKIYLPFYFLIFCVLEVYPEPPRFFIKISKILMRLNVVLEDLQPQNVMMFLFPMKHLWLRLTVKITPGVNNSDLYMVWNCCCRQFSACSFWCLIIATTKLMQYVDITLFFRKWNLQEISTIAINFLFELPNHMSLIGSYSASLLIKILYLLRKCAAKFVKCNTSNNKLIKYNTSITNLFKAWFSTCKKTFC